MVEKTYQIKPYLSAFGAYLMHQYGSKAVSIYKNNRWNVAVTSGYLPSGHKAVSFGPIRPQKTMVEKTYHLVRESLGTGTGTGSGHFWS